MKRRRSRDEERDYWQAEEDGRRYRNGYSNRVVSKNQVESTYNDGRDSRSRRCLQAPYNDEDRFESPQKDRRRSLSPSRRHIKDTRYPRSGTHKSFEDIHEGARYEPRERRYSGDSSESERTLRDDRHKYDGPERYERSGSSTHTRLTVAELRAKREALFRQQFGYSSQDNPFGDTKLAEPFLWRKKLEMGQVEELKAEEYLAKTKMKLSEIGMVKQRRQEREREERLHEDFKATIARERDAESFEQWKKIEDDFLKSITQMRTMLRIKERREDVFDVLLKILEMSRMMQFSDMRLPDVPPDDYLSQQKDEKLSETMDHIKVRLRIEKKEMLRMSLSDNEASINRQELENNIKYWSSLETIVKFIMTDRGRGVTRDTFKESRAKKRLSNKSLAELEEIERVIQANLENPDDTQDIHFNEMLQARLPYFKAVAYVTDLYRKAQEYARVVKMEENGQETTDVKKEAPMMPRTFSDEEDGYWSPRQYKDEEPDVKRWPSINKLDIEEVEQDAEVTEWHFNLDDEGLLADEKSQQEEEDADLFFERFVQREKDLKQEDEIVLEGQEVEVIQPTDNGELRRLRKPRYFNRVKTGFEWNRYNQTHYDQETPPPKVVQGYKFTISYPNLAEKGQAPTWRILPSETPNDGTVILLFSGGPPYEDLAFRIVNREWDCNPKRGFKNRFDHSILQLHFNFKRLRYRK